jgi:hypothetical protein
MLNLSVRRTEPFGSAIFLRLRREERDEENNIRMKRRKEMKRILQKGHAMKPSSSHITIKQFFLIFRLPITRSLLHIIILWLKKRRKFYFYNTHS